MQLNETAKNQIKKEIVRQLQDAAEISKIIIFGSFVRDPAPNDVDIAIFQTTSEPYLPLAIKYRTKLTSVARQIPIDVIPVRPNPEKSSFLDEILSGEVLYEK